MWIEQKVYTFNIEKGGDVNLEDILDNIFLRVNENLTTITLEQLFLKHTKPEIEKGQLIVKGWSLLEKVIPISGAYLASKANKEPEANDLVKISFNSDSLGDLEILEIENPLFQASDKTIEDSEVEEFNEKIIELSRLKIKDDKVGDDVIPHTETPTAIFNKKYENGKVRYLNNGYKEFVDVNYKLLIKNDGNKTKASFYNIVSEDDIDSYNDVKEINENEFEVFGNDNKILFSLKVEDGKLNVTPLVESVSE